MTRKLITLMAACGLTLGGLTYLQAGEHEHGPGPKMHHMGNPLEHLSEKLDLTAEQKAKVQPIIDQTKPQIAAIHQEAMEKMRAIMENAGGADPSVAHAAATGKIRCDEKGARRHAQGDAGNARRREKVTAVCRGETRGGDRKVAAVFFLLRLPQL